MHLHRFTRSTSRLQSHDYSSGTYFITISANKHACLFGEITNNSFHPNALGSIISGHLQILSIRFPNAKILSYQLMPNHLHLIIEITKPTMSTVGAGFPRPILTIPRPTLHPFAAATPSTPSTPSTTSTTSTTSTGRENRAPTLGNIIAWLKYNSTKEINIKKLGKSFLIFQRNYYEHIIRDQNDLIQKIKYIENNVNTWPHDQDNPHRYSRGGVSPPDTNAEVSPPDTTHDTPYPTNVTNRRGGVSPPDTIDRARKPRPYTNISHLFHPQT